VRKVYKYRNWKPEVNVETIMEELEGLYKDGWAVVSHDHGVYGMSVILMFFKTI